jgi:uncharacterized protein YggE
MATVSLVVESKAAAVSDAADTSGQIVTTVIETLRTHGIEDQDIQSTGINIWREEVYDFDTGRPTVQQLFHLDRPLTVTIHGVDRVASVIQPGDAGCYLSGRPGLHLPALAFVYGAVRVHGRSQSSMLE